MVELLILYLLQENKNSTYGLKKLAEERFSTFFKFSFGTIHPALKRLKEKGCLLVKTAISTGGQRKTTYSITKDGYEYYQELLLQELPDNPQLAEQIICIRIMAIEALHKDLKKIILTDIKKYYEIAVSQSKTLLANEYVELDNIQKGWVNTTIKTYEQKIDWLNSL